MKRDTFERLKKMGIDFDDDFENLMVKPLEKQSEKIEEKKEVDVDRYDFLPIVKVNNSEDAKNAIISVKENETYKKDKIDLGADYDKDKRDYLVADIIITQNSVARIPLMVKRGFDPWGLQDDDGVLTFECSNSSVKLKFIDREDTDYKDTAKEYNLNKAANGDVFVMEITPSSLKRGTKFTITVYASDNDDRNKSSRKGVCGKFNLKIVEQDVFMEEEKEKVAITNENLVGVDRICFRVADKELAELLNNNKLVLSNYANENSYTRMKSYKSLGLIKNEKIFDQFIFKGGGNYVPQEYSGSNSNPFQNYFEPLIKGKIGYHIFYFSLLEGYHVLTLIINNTEEVNRKFLVLDQIRIRKWDDFENIDKEMLRLTNVLWLGVYEGQGKKYKTESAIWKIQR